MSQQDRQITEYIRNVCKHIKCKEVHSEIEEELRSHIEEIVEEYIADGMHKTEAISKAIQQMGDPHILGKQFHQRHKPRTEWSLIGMVLTFIGIGLVIMYSIEHSQSRRIPETLFMDKTFAATIGIAISLFLFFFDYRKLKGYSHYLYFFTLSMMLVTLLFGVHINGRPMLNLGPITVDFFNLSPYMLVIALGGILSTWSWNQSKLYLKVILLVGLPCMMFLLSSTLFSAFLFLLCSIILLAASQSPSIQKRNIMLLFTLSFGILISYTMISKPYLFDRLTTFLNPYQEPLASGYLYVQSKEAISSAGFWGQGVSSAYQSLPNQHTEFAFTYFIYSFGWVAGAVMFGLAMLFIFRLGSLSNRIRDPFGSLVAKGMVTIFSIKFLWTMLMSFSLVPVIGIGLPFISHGGAEFLVQMVAFGLILSIYRRKDLVKTSYSTET